MNEILEKMRNRGYKITKQRKKVLSVLSSSKYPISAHEIFRKSDGVDLASVYRILSVLENISLVNSESFRGEKIYCLALHPHHHIVCRKCGRIESFKCNHKFDDFENFTDIKHQLTVSGVCKKCKNNNY